jgi:dephospho-CoA kinase
MLLVGLTGGVATGKSTVARLFQAQGAYIIDADVLARQVVEPGKPAWRDVVKTFGEEILNRDRTVNRPALGRIVFRNANKLKALGRIIHPRVAREQARLAREIAQKDPAAVIIYDAPVLIEARAHQRMDRLIVVSADQRTQIKRVQQRDGLSRADALRRIRCQMSLAQKIRQANYVVNGSASPRQLTRSIGKLYNELQQLASEVRH